MKKLILLIFLAFNAQSELVLEITKSSNDPYKIAIHDFLGAKDIAPFIESIVKTDLIRTGEFDVLGSEDLLSDIKSDEQINYKGYRLLGVDFILIGKVINEGDSSLTVEYAIHDASKEKKIRSSKVYGIPNKTRQLAHYVSDGIYEEITDLPGVASTKMLYVSEVDQNSSQIFRLMMSDSDGMNEQVLLRSNKPIISPTWSPDSKVLHMFHLRLVWQKSLFRILQQVQEK